MNLFVTIYILILYLDKGSSYNGIYIQIIYVTILLNLSAGVKISKFKFTGMFLQLIGNYCKKNIFQLLYSDLILGQMLLTQWYMPTNNLCYNLIKGKCNY
jgi:hypothetical protein